MSETLTCKNCGTHFLNHRKRPDRTPKNLCSRCLEKFNQWKPLATKPPLRIEHQELVNSKTMADFPMGTSDNDRTGKRAIGMGQAPQKPMPNSLPNQSSHQSQNNQTVLVWMIGMSLILCVLAGIFQVAPFFAFQYRALQRLDDQMRVIDEHLSPKLLPTSEMKQLIDKAVRSEAELLAKGNEIVGMIWRPGDKAIWPQENLRVIYLIKSENQLVFNGIEVHVNFNHVLDEVRIKEIELTDETWQASELNE